MERNDMMWHYRNMNAVNALKETASAAGVSLTERQVIDMVDRMVDDGFSSLIADSGDEPVVTFATRREFEEVLDDEKDRINDEWISALDYAIGGNSDEVLDSSGIVVARKLDEALEEWRHDRTRDDVADGMFVDTRDLSSSEVAQVRAFIESIKRSGQA